MASERFRRPVCRWYKRLGPSRPNNCDTHAYVLSVVGACVVRKSFTREQEVTTRGHNKRSQRAKMPSCIEEQLIVMLLSNIFIRSTAHEKTKGCGRIQSVQCHSRISNIEEACTDAPSSAISTAALATQTTLIQARPVAL